MAGCLKQSLNKLPIFFITDARKSSSQLCIFYIAWFISLFAYRSLGLKIVGSFSYLPSPALLEVRG